MQRVYMSKTNKKLKIDVLVPGFTKDEVKTSIRQKYSESEPTIVVKCKAKDENVFAYKQPFKGYFPINPDFDEEKVEISLANGVLTIIIPRTPLSKGTPISINK